MPINWFKAGFLFTLGSIVSLVPIYFVTAVLMLLAGPS